MAPLKTLNNEHNAVIKKPSMPVKPITPVNNQPKPVQVVKRPATQMTSPPAKKIRMTSLKDVTMSEAGKYGTLNEYAFFDKVRKALKSQEVYDNFLRCLIIYNQEIISRADLVLVVTPFLSKYADLFKWFKDFLGYKESNNVDIVPKKLEKEEQQRVTGEFATEIDYSSCIKYGASYRAVPRNYVQPKCSGRTALCREVLNDTWVSFPSWSEDSTFVSSRKTQFEEYIYRCEDERFELDVVIETNLSTIRVLESEVTKMNRMSAEEKARYRLDDTLGGSSSVIQQRAIRRIYGDKSPDIIEGLKKNPANSVPLVLRRLKAKDEEWRKSQKLFNKIWREQNEKYYLKSLDHQGINFKQNDVKFLRSKSILNEIETIYEERHEQADEGMLDVATGPHLVLTYKNKEIFEEAANLIIHHVKRQTGIHKEDKKKIKQLMMQFFPDFFFVPRGELSDDEVEKDEDMETEDGNGSPKPGAYKNLWSLSIACKNSAPLAPKGEKTRSTNVNGSLPDESWPNVLYVNNHWYVFFRLHHILCERLWKLHERAQALIQEELRDQEERKQSTALALRLKQPHNLDVEATFTSFLEMVKNLLDNNLESNQYEDNLREMFGIQAYLGFTLDKVIQNVVRQLQHMVGDEQCVQWTTLYLQEVKKRKECATASQRAAAELAYQRTAEAISEDNLFKLLMYKDESKLTIELLDTDSDMSEDPSHCNKWITFVRKFCEESMVNNVKDHIKRNPPFLFRLITSYMSRKKLQRDRESGVRELRSIQEEIDESKIDLSRLEDGGAGEAVKGLVGLNAKAKFLQSRRQRAEENSSSSSVCRFNVNSFKMLWVVDCEDNNICQPHCLHRARKSHKRVSDRLNRRFRSWHRSWLKENVSEEQEKQCKNWLLGLVEDNVPTLCIRVDNPLKPPYTPYNRYRPQDKT